MTAPSAEMASARAAFSAAIPSRPCSAKKFDVGGADVGDDGGVGAGDGCERGDLAGVVHPDLPDGRLVAVVGFEDGEREAEVVVEIARGPGDGVAGRQDSGGEFLGARLTAGSGDGEGPEVEFVAVGGGEGLERGEGVGDTENREICRRAGDVGVDEGGGGSLFNGGGDEGVAVVTVAVEREVEVAGFERAGVLRDAGDGEIAVAGNERAVGPGGDFGKREGVHFSDHPPSSWVWRRWRCERRRRRRRRCGDHFQIPGRSRVPCRR